MLHRRDTRMPCLVLLKPQTLAMMLSPLCRLLSRTISTSGVRRQSGFGALRTDTSRSKQVPESECFSTLTSHSSSVPSSSLSDQVNGLPKESADAQDSIAEDLVNRLKSTSLGSEQGSSKQEAREQQPHRRTLRERGSRKK